MVLEDEETQVMLGESPGMQQVMEQIRQVAPYPIPVLIVGESGTGKELVARSIHESSPRASGPFLPVHAASLPRELIQSELFGYERGSFTGASHSKEGLMETAEGGTLFLDEITTMEEKAQVSLLRVLETRYLQRTGGSRFIEVDFRLVAAANEDLLGALREGRLRLDLYHRLSVFQIHLPPLRDRGADVPMLAQHFLEHYARLFHKETGRFSQAALRVLCSYDWPGNVRELQNAVQQAVILAEGRTVDVEHLPQELVEAGDAREIVLEVGATLQEVEKLLIARTLQEVHGNKREAAEILGISRKGIYNKIRRHQIV
jgi:DNA-binding NtrC family response regulator